MKDLNEKNFGIVIAFLLPGFILLWGLSFSFEEVRGWLEVSAKKDGLTVGGFLYATLASLSLGMVISAVRWLLIDHIFSNFGIRDPGLNWDKLKEKDRGSRGRRSLHG